MSQSFIPPQLRRIRNRRGMTLANVSTRTGMSVQHLSKIEGGDGRGTQLLSIEKVAASLGYTLVLVPSDLAPAVRGFINSNGRVFGVSKEKGGE